MRRTLTLIGLLLALAAPAAARPLERVSADFADPVDAPSMVGFVHGMDKRSPPADMITPLEPTLWRGKLRDVPYGRVQELGGRYTYVLSDRWGYPGDGHPAPYDDYAAWERFVRGVAQRGRAATTPLVWDVWNEPDSDHFWRGTRDQFYETYRIAENVLRRELGPHAVVGGPSTSAWRRDWLVGLLEYCRRWGCEVNVLSWHELGGGSIPAVETNLDSARALMRSPRYPAQRVAELQVNESGSAIDQYRPGELLGYKHYLELGGASATARACWDDLAGDSNCYNDTLAGLLVPGTFAPRSAWWATKAYAEGVGSRRRTWSTDPAVIGIASARSARPRTAQLLIAHFQHRPRPRGGNPAAVDVRVELDSLDRLSWLRAERRLRVAIERYPDTGELPLPQPRCRRDARVELDHGHAELTLHDVRLHEAYRLTLSVP